MKEIDFLPEWYRESKRRRSRLRKQYAALVLIFTCMMTYNLAVTHHTARATARLACFEDERISAESVLHEFNIISKELGEVRVKADLVEQIDAKIDVSAVLAELSHVIDATVVLTRVEAVAEPVSGSSDSKEAKTSGLRTVESGVPSAPSPHLGQAKFRILLAGLAASPADVAGLVCRLDESSYFRNVHASWRNSAVDLPVAERNVGRKPPGTPAAAPRDVSIEVSEFEIVCHLANFEEIDDQ